jgi:hypothetical protein
MTDVVRKKITHSGRPPDMDTTRTGRRYKTAADTKPRIPSETRLLYFDSRTPTSAELDTLIHYPLMLENDWDPHTIQLGRKVMAVTSYVDEGIEGHRELFHDGYSYSIEPHLSSREVAQVATDLPNARGFQSSERHPHATAETLSNLWYIGLETAAKTLKATTQKGARSAVLPLSRRLVTDLVYWKPRLRGRFYTDTVYGRHSSLTGNKCMQVFVNNSFFAVAYPMETKRYAGKALKEFINEFGNPELLTFDGSKEQTAKNSEFMQTVRKYDIDYHTSEPYQPKQNPAERVIRELRRRWFRVVRQNHVPPRLWDFGYCWCCKIMNSTVNSVYSLEGRTPIEQITGETPDISEYTDFGFYDWVWYRDNGAFGENQLGRWLGVSHRIGPVMCYSILTDKCQVVTRTTVSRVTNLEKRVDLNRTLMAKFEDAVYDRLHDSKYTSIGLDEPIAWRQLADLDDPE